ncbi:sensor histidine kinase [Inmirania thermothiophila]|uniref:Two-component system sensor histidine kinase AlgZ n=1 Tax=Inmirania thermothiophila TaxID=1750597 RepID=A0A3N1Y6F4_9GAMM|nr:histidine kinase [Inmirania thermothiophila]ROR34399.1 two-component system sensor histidine kinase AlgZ [Inmirania thermothiophila]
MHPRERDETSFLPDFCAVRVLLALVLAVELLALVLVLAAPAPSWGRLALVSLLAQWVALGSAALLCPLRRALGGRHPGAVAAGALAVVALVAAASAAAAQAAGLAPAGPALVARVAAVALIGAGLALRHLYVQHQWRRQLEAESEARVAALRARIRPHFLFNSMNTIAALTRSDPARAEEAVQDLAELFRAALEDGREHASLGEEVALARRYLDIEALRLGPRLRVRWAIELGTERFRLPPLTLQPLVENAVYHGIEPLPEGGEVLVQARRQGRGLRLEVRNPLPADAPPRAGHRMALDNVRQRLAAAFGPRARLEAGPEDGGYLVSIEVEAD